jgi:hypothetical protein
MMNINVGHHILRCRHWKMSNIIPLINRQVYIWPTFHTKLVYLQQQLVTCVHSSSCNFRGRRGEGEARLCPLVPQPKQTYCTSPWWQTWTWSTGGMTTAVGGTTSTDTVTPKYTCCTSSPWQWMGMVQCRKNLLQCCHFIPRANVGLNWSVHSEIQDINAWATAQHWM